MYHRKQRSFVQKTSLLFRISLRRYPALSYIFKWSLISLLVGILAGSASAGFLQSLEWITVYREMHIGLVACLPLAGLLVGLLYHYKGKNVAAGNKLLLDTIRRPAEIIPFRMAPLVYTGTMLTHLFGGSAGREGTALQIAGSLADQFSKPLRLRTDDRKIMLRAAIAAGFGSVFGTPLAGAIFALEVVGGGRLKYRAVFPVFAAAIVADRVAGLWHTQHTVYTIHPFSGISLLSLVYALLAGIAFGCCAALFTKALHLVTALFARKITYPPLRPFAGGIIIVVVVWALGTTKFIGLGIPVIVAAFDQQLPATDFILKMCFTVLTLGAGFKGGEVTPLFFIGAALGSSLSGIIPLPPDLMAGMGFVAVFAGAANAPLACTIMAMELFGSEWGIFAAIACVVSYLFSGHNSIYGRHDMGNVKNARPGADDRFMEDV